MKLSEYATKNNISYKTAWNHFKAGKIANARQLPTGTVVVDEIADAKDEIISLQKEKIKMLEEEIDRLKK
jgi:predicted site-specific integrase-resolvase